MRLAPQELRTYFVTTVTANRRRLFQSESAANLMVNVLQEIRHFERFEACQRYIEENPVRAPLLTVAGEYPFSSAHLIEMIDPVPDHFTRCLREVRG